MTWLAYDTAGTLDLAAAKARGCVGVGLYLGSNLTLAQVAQAAKLDIGVWSFWERNANDPDLGAVQGVLDANDACDKADKVGQHLGAPIYIPNDEVILNARATLAYFGAVAKTILGRHRVPALYGQECLYWDTYKAKMGFRYFCHASDGTNPPYTGANILQGNVAQIITIGGVSCDVDTIQTPDFGGWNKNGLFAIGGGRRKADMLCKAKGTLGPWYYVTPFGKQTVNATQLALANKLGFVLNENVDPIDLAKFPVVK